ncbi:MAG: hypothetical protein M3Q69_00250 [Acidobacteriota bacterium]|nr:hypothetical protein [Acidobacteriota bacterium]
MFNRFAAVLSMVCALSAAAQEVPRSEVATPARSLRTGDVSANTVNDGTHGSIDFTSPSGYTTTGVLLTADPLYPFVIAKTGTATSGSAFSVFNSANAEQFRVQGNGLVGIGTSNPSDLLHVYGATGTSLAVQAHQNTWNGVTSATDLAKLNLGFWIDSLGGGLKDLATIAVRSGNPGGDWRSSIVFLNRDSTATQYERMRVDSSGNIGIGTTTPTDLLHVSGAPGTALAVQSHQAAWSTTNSTITNATDLAKINLGFTIDSAFPTGFKDLATISVRPGNAGVDFRSHLLFFNRDGSGNQLERMRIDSSGNVGIGTSAPSELVHAMGAPGSSLTIQGHQTNWTSITNATDVAKLNLGLLLDAYAGFKDLATISVRPGNAGGDWRGQMVFFTRDSAAVQQERIRIDGIGNVGIGTNAPTAKLHVGGDVLASGNLVATGNVGIGITTPAYKLDVAGNIHATGTISGGTVVATYQDVAEWVPSNADLAPGTVVVLNRSQENEVMASTHAYDASVAGVVSAQPGLILGVAAPTKEQIATTGRVKVRVDATAAPIAIGDLLVTSDKPGVAMKSMPLDLGGVAIHRPGTILGKALQPLASGEGEILVLLSLQ